MNMKKKIAVRKLLSGVLVLLGFTACDSDDPGNGLCDYGTPSADYQVKGKVLDPTGKPIKGVQVVVKDLNAYFVKGEKDYVVDYDTVYTDVKGEFESDKAHTFSIGSQEVLFHDVDGEENGGEFESATLKTDQMDISQIKEGGSWYSGAYELKAEVKLSPKKK